MSKQTTAKRSIHPLRPVVSNDNPAHFEESTEQFAACCERLGIPTLDGGDFDGMVVPGKRVVPFDWFCQTKIGWRDARYRFDDERHTIIAKIGDSSEDFPLSPDLTVVDLAQHGRVIVDKNLAVELDARNNAICQASEWLKELLKA